MNLGTKKYMVFNSTLYFNNVHVLLDHATVIE